MKFKTSSGIKSIVGKDLITDRYIAIFELVKNSYDARATEVIVSFNTSEDTENGIGNLENGKIYIVDNGKGMTKDDLNKKWLVLAYSDKKEGHSDDINIDEEDGLRALKNRTYVGSKGIGRFSSDSLGSLITLKTKVANEDFEHQLTVNWSEFDESLEVLFEEIEVNYQKNTKLSRNGYNSYTIIEISNLRQTWTEEQLDGVVEKLRRLKNPFIDNDDLNIYFGLNLFKTGEMFVSNPSALITSNIAQVLKEKSINITALMKDGYIGIQLKDRGELIYKIKKKNDTVLKNLNKIKVSINYLNQSAKQTFTRRMGVPPVQYGNLFIYRNGFHVSPYGDEDYDIFSLNLRKTQGYNRYIATRELIGFISIDDDKNYFKETSSRNNGFIENGYFKSLENFYMEEVHKPLERYIQLIQWGEAKGTEQEIFLKDIDLEDNEKNNFKKYITRHGYEIIKFNELLDFEKNKPEKIIERIVEKATLTNKPSTKIKTQAIKKDTQTLKKQFKGLEKESKEKDKKIKDVVNKNQNLERQNQNLSSKRSEQSYGEQITHHFTKLSSRLSSSIKKLEKIKHYIPEDELKDFNIALRRINRTQYELKAFQEILTKTEIETRKGTLVNWIELFKWHFSEIDMDKLMVTVNASSETVFDYWEIANTHVVEVIIMLDNFYENAKEHEASILDFEFFEDYILVSSNSTLIPENILNNVFELGFSTKENGTGIGLNQVKLFLKKNKMIIDVSNIDDLVQFKICKET